MKKILLCVCLVVILGTCAIAKGSHSPTGHNCSSNCHHNHPHHTSGSSSSEHVYLTNTEHNTYEQKFPNCKDHYAITETTTNYYSNGTKNVFSNSTIYNSDGSVLETDCLNIEHIIFDDKHYFIINKKGKGYRIIDDSANVLTTRKYTKMSALENGKILVRYDKKYGVTDLHEKTIIPIKYQQMDIIAKDVFLTKLNGYYGIIDINNNIMVRNDCDKIKMANDVLIIKRYNKYGLASRNGKIIYDIKYDKIKKFGEYMLIKQDKKFGIYNPETKESSQIKYKKIKLERNALKGTIAGEAYAEIDLTCEKAQHNDKY